MPADTLKIVFKGKTAANEDTIEKLAIKETDFIVVMAQVAVFPPSRRSHNLSPRRRPSPSHRSKKRKNKWHNKPRRKALRRLLSLSHRRQDSSSRMRLKSPS